MKLDQARATLTAATLAAVLAGLPAMAQTNNAAEKPADTAAQAQTTGAAAATEGAGADTEAPPDLSAATVLATVGGKDITLGEMISLRRDLPAQYQQLPDEVLSQGLLDQLIDQTLLAEAARKDKIDERLDVALSIRNQIRAILSETWLRQEIQSRLTEKRLHEAYDKRYANAEPVEEVHAAHILVDSEEKAKEIKKKLDDGADFAKLAAEYGTDGTASRGGDLGWFTKQDMVPEFADAAFSIPVGQIGGPVKSPFGWHIIKVEDKRQKPVPPFDEVKDTLASDLAQEIQTEILDELRAETKVVMKEPGVPAAAIRADDLILPEDASGEGQGAASNGGETAPSSAN